jgi:hypothetical protein
VLCLEYTVFGRNLLACSGTESTPVDSDGSIKCSCSSSEPSLHPRLRWRSDSFHLRLLLLLRRSFSGRLLLDPSGLAPFAVTPRARVPVSTAVHPLLLLLLLLLPQLLLLLLLLLLPQLLLLTWHVPAWNRLQTRLFAGRSGGSVRHGLVPCSLGTLVTRREGHALAVEPY